MFGNHTIFVADIATTIGGAGVVLALVLAIVCFWTVVIYNGLRRKQVRARNAFSQIDVQLKRRHDLIPNLVETVKGYMTHERETLEAVVRARAQASGALGAVEGGAMGIASMSALANASGALDSAIGRLMGLIERYPDLKASESTLRLQEELASTENRIAFARQAFNDAVMRLNESIVVFPASIVARVFGVREMGLFEAESDARANVAVKF